MTSGNPATNADAGARALRIGWWISAIAFLSGIGGGAVFPILPILGVRLGLSAALVGLILAANRITRIFFNPFTGVLLDRFGARRPVAFGLFFETVAVLAFSVALYSSAPGVWFVAGRAVWGIGSSLVMVGALAAVMVVSTPETRGRLASRVRTAMTLGIPAGMLVGGIISDLASPNAAFLTASALSFATGLFALRVMPRGGPAPGHGRDKSPTLDVLRALSRNRVLQIVWGSNALVSFAIVGVLLATLVVLVDARHIRLLGLDSQGSAGVLMALLMLFRAVASLGAGAFLDRHSGRTSLLIPGAVVTALGFAGLAVAGATWSLGLSLAALGVGGGMLNIPLLTLLSDTATRETQGRAMGLYQVYGDVGGSLGPIVGLEVGTRLGYSPLYLGIAVAMVAVIVPLYWLVRHEPAGPARRAF